MTAEQRRAIFDRVVDRSSRRGLAFETNPVFRANVDEWIEGRISLDELKKRYGDLILSRRCEVSGGSGTEAEE